MTATYHLASARHASGHATQVSLLFALSLSARLSPRCQGSLRHKRASSPHAVHGSLTLLAAESLESLARPEARDCPIRPDKKGSRGARCNICGGGPGGAAGLAKRASPFLCVGGSFWRRQSACSRLLLPFWALDLCSSVFGCVDERVLGCGKRGMLSHPFTLTPSPVYFSCIGGLSGPYLSLWHPWQLRRLHMSDVEAYSIVFPSSI